MCSQQLDMLSPWAPQRLILNPASPRLLLPPPSSSPQWGLPPWHWVSQLLAHCSQVRPGWQLWGAGASEHNAKLSDCLATLEEGPEDTTWRKATPKNIDLKPAFGLFPSGQNPVLASGQVGVSPLQSPQLPVSGAGQGQVITAVYPTPTGTSPVQSASHSVVYSVAATGTTTVSSPTAILPKGGSASQSAGCSNHSLISTGMGWVMGIGVARGKKVVMGELSPREKTKRERRQGLQRT